jgi:putative ABC transport system ATP-binding protein
MGAPSPIVSVRDISHDFTEGESTHRVLHNVSAEFLQGEVVVIRGPSGSGKTTLLKLIGAQRAIQSGDIHIGGRSLAKAAPPELVTIRRGIGFIFQSHHLLKSLTVLQNVQMPLTHDLRHDAASSAEAALRMLERVGLRAHANKPPMHLSGGQSQRVAIARALVASPRIILADEPTAALDKHTGREVVTLLHDLAKKDGVTVVLVTHDDRILDVADRILHMEDGYLADHEVR